MKTFYNVLALLAIIVISFLAGTLTRHIIQHEGGAVIITDTVTVLDTMRIPYPIIVDVTISEDMIEIPVAGITVKDDSIAVFPAEVRTYEGETYRAQVSGYRPNLDWIETFTETKYITNTIADNRKNMFYISGEIMYYGNMSAPALLTYQRNWKHISLQAGAGYDFIGNQIIISAGIKIPVVRW